MDREQPDLSGLRILVVEDMLLVAEEISEQLRSWGCDVVGPMSRVESALTPAREAPLDGALLDVNLAGESCFPLAAALSARSVPFVFMTGYDGGALPPEYRTVPRLGKPIAARELARVAAERFRPRT
jgi:CheY-like chemotaxis protein